MESFKLHKSLMFSLKLEKKNKSMPEGQIIGD